VKIYVAGGSSELDLVEGYMMRLRKAGYQITDDWPTLVRKVGASNPRDASDADKFSWSGANLRGILNADLVWVILPVVPSFGCAFEFGYARGLARNRLRPQVVIVSGDWRATIFSVQANRLFETHDHALGYLTDLARPHADP
jgi:hypothetical protein